jgi:hypothetical protein
MSNVIFLVASLLGNVKCNYFGYIDALSKYSRSTTGYGCLGETSITRLTPSTSFKMKPCHQVCKKLRATTIVDNAFATKYCSQAIKEVP